jgi:hypothetical protein
MAVVAKSKVNPKHGSKAGQLLAYARVVANRGADSTEFFNAIYGKAGKANELFPTDSERASFLRTKECKEIRKLKLALPDPPVQVIGDALSNEPLSVTLRLPKSIHQSLLAEAAEEGVSLDQLCLSKLVAQLRELV